MFLSGTAKMITLSTVRKKWMNIFINSMKSKWEGCECEKLWKGGMRNMIVPDQRLYEIRDQEENS